MSSTSDISMPLIATGTPGSNSNSTKAGVSGASAGAA